MLFIDTKNKKEYKLSGRIITIGSAKECHIHLNDKAIPSRIAHLIFKEGEHVIQGLTKNMKLNLNGKIITKEERLTPGDEITLGSYMFLYAESSVVEKKEKLNIDSSDSTSFYNELISVIVTLLKNRDDTVFEALVTSISRLLKSDASRLVQEDPLTGKRKTIARYPEGMSLDRYSEQAIEWAKHELRTVLLHDSDWKNGKDTLNSLEKNFVSSILCTPLISDETVFGYLYLDRLQESGLFTEKDRIFCDSLSPLYSEIVKIFYEHERQREIIERLQKEHGSSANSMIYESESMKKTIELAATFAKTNAPVIITGETGTGKEVMASYIHEQSQRADKLFRAINCGAIPENLIESELFGHEKGAFTGASQRKIGLFESVNTGTLFLDEIGELPMHLQVKLLRVIQEQEITRVGGSDTIKVDVRIITATNRDLEKEVSFDRFRQDLYFRLNVLSVKLPPLRDRNQDVLILAEFFINKYTQQFGLTQKILSTQAKKVLLSHGWQGNIRELENVIQKAILLSKDNKLMPENLSLSYNTSFNTVSSDKSQTLKDAREYAEKAIIKKTLIKTEGNVSLASNILNIDRKWLIKKMKEFEIDAHNFK